ncbi:hypothetical protein NL108_018127 [Boleophthalmus pectinirostris]|uniref:equilibrative nucleoside transporter 2-like n=1 Tax=Boleophthalmus pectinirostris TaxID=150288 RepID=UPI00243283B7|nr:equilibrative nucleoside transporter 2-like [Boleophthalmus pectinirostris]KAJ0059998.1 hypothetical protein NL108_018127 [Boleophthalmus pectinirostris]
MWPRLISCLLLIIAFARGAVRHAIPVTCLFGQRCVLPCHIQKGLSRIIWSKDFLPVQYFPRTGEYHEHGSYRNRTCLFEQEFHNGNCSLAIDSTTLKDDGLFKCAIWSQSKEENDLYFKVQVDVPVEKVVIKRVGDVLICSSERVHPKAQCRWSDDFSNPGPTVSPDDQHLCSINCTTPLLRNVSQYTCIVSTPFSSKRATYAQMQPLSEYVSCMTFAVLIVTVLIFLSTYKRKETNSEVSTSDSKLNSSQRIHTVKYIYGLLGLGSMFPCQLLEISSLYLNRHMDQTWIFSFIALVSQLPTLISVVVNSFFVSRFSPQKYILGCLVLVLVIFVIMLIFIKVPISKEIFFYINMTSLWLVALFSCMITHNLSVKFDSLPEILRKAFYLCQLSAGTVASIVMIISVAIADADAANMQFCCYSFAIVVSLVSLVAYCIYHCRSSQKHQPEQKTGAEQLPLNNLSSNNNNSNNHEPPPCLDGEGTNTTGGNFCTFWYIALVPLVTFSVYPAVTADIQTVSSGTWERFFIPVCCFLVFNIFNWIGQKTVSIFETYFLKHFLIVFPLLFIFHTGLMFVLLFCHIHPRVRHFNNIVFPIIMAFFSLSHVVLSHLSMLYKRDLEKGPDVSKNLWRAIGSTAGIALSFALRALVQFITPN